MAGIDSPEMRGVFLGRLSPIHLGHEQVIDHMMDTCGPDNSTIIIGSSNTPTSMRHFFTYEERRDLVKRLYPDARVMPLPDFSTDQEWMVALDDLLEGANGKEHSGKVRFFGGSDEDVQFFLDAGRDVKILNRFDGTTPKISATEVRDSLLHERSLEGLLNPTIEEFVVKLFWEKWEQFKKA